MTTLEKFNRTIIEALHGKNYEEMSDIELIKISEIKSINSREEWVYIGEDYRDMNDRGTVQDTCYSFVHKNPYADIETYSLKKHDQPVHIETLKDFLKDKYFELNSDISRVMKALYNKIEKGWRVSVNKDYVDNRKCIIEIQNGGQFIYIEWRLTKQDGYTTATSEDQDEKTLTKIMQLLK